MDDKVYNDLKNRGLTGMLTSKECECMNKSICSGTPLEDELDRLKEKINSEDVNCQYEEDYVYSSGLQKSIEVINNRIEELKGE